LTKDIPKKEVLSVRCPKPAYRTPLDSAPFRRIELH